MTLTLTQQICIWALPVIFALTLHEVAHGLAALYFGDHTARLSGRLSLNPLHHIDWLGTVIIPLMLLSTSHLVFGWAKPVPVDERNLAPHHRRIALACIASAGPLANLLMAFVWGSIAKIGAMSWMFTEVSRPMIYMGQAGLLFNSILAVLNLIPLPPLDGGKVATCLLPPRAAYYFSFLEPYGFFILLLLLLSGVLSYLIGPPIFLLTEMITDLFGIG